MFYILSDLNDKFVQYLEQDPVRASIPAKNRIGQNKDVFILLDNDKVQAITCVSYQTQVPDSEATLFESLIPELVVFYTIWSYQPGAGRQLILESMKYIRENKPFIKRFLTLSPKTDMAKHFHLKNGAQIFKENLETVNYEYNLTVP